MLNFKKLLSLALVGVILLAAASLTSYLVFAPSGNSLGIGIYETAGSYTDAAEKNGSTKVSYTVCALLTDKENKVLDCQIDALDATVSFTAEGKYVELGELKTKGELGYGYGMNEKMGVPEWFEQRDAFVSTVIGKSASEIAKLVTDTGKGSDEVISAGCTITVTDFVKAINAAFAALKPTDASENDEVRLGIVAAQSKGESVDATAESNGKLRIALTAVCAAVDGDRISAAITDGYNTDVQFTAAGAAVPVKESSSKRAQGNEYGMKEHGGATLEWYEQADVFDSKLTGLAKADIPSLVSETGKGNAEVVAAGCTITVSDFVKAANKLFS